MKKRLLLSSILAFASIFANFENTHAMTIDEKGDRWWTIEELLRVTKKMDEITKELCGDKPECLMDETFKLIDSDGKYRAADILNNMILMITDINPADNTIKVLFNGEDGMMKRMGHSEKYDLDELIIVWRGKEDAPNSFVDPIRSGEEAVGWHEIFTYLGGETNIKEGKEIELKGLPSSNLIDNKKGILEYSVLAGPLGAGGIIDYTSCLNSPDYKEGMGCKMMISENPDIAFVPYEITKDDPLEEVEKANENKTPEAQLSSKQSSNEKKDNESTISIAPHNTSEPNGEKMIAHLKNNDTENIMELKKDYVDKQDNASGNIGVPNSGDNCENEHFSFPWWFLILLVILDILLVWWWMPSKNQKKMKKS